MNFIMIGLRLRETLDRLRVRLSMTLYAYVVVNIVVIQHIAYMLKITLNLAPGCRLSEACWAWNLLPDVITIRLVVSPRTNVSSITPIFLAHFTHFLCPSIGLRFAAS